MKKTIFTLLAALTITSIGIGCGDDGNGTRNTNEPDTLSGDTSTAANAAKCLNPSQTTAIDQNFDAMVGPEDIPFYMSKPDQSKAADKILENNGTKQTIAGHDAIYLHGGLIDNYTYGDALEMQLNLDTKTDLSCQDFTISFDVYIPLATFEKSPKVAIQWSFLETEAFTGIYGPWTTITAADTWTTITGTVKDAPDIEHKFSSIADWQIDAVRVQLILGDDTSVEILEGVEADFYVDNVVVKNF